MKYAFLSLLFLLLFLQYGCDRPEKDSKEYGTVLYALPDIPDAKKPFPLPDVEGVNTQALQEFYEESRHKKTGQP
ncbi:MAG: hypothetical protein ACRC10_04130 [Thermoguttaceae bacterium]